MKEQPRKTARYKRLRGRHGHGWVADAILERWFGRKPEQDAPTLTATAPQNVPKLSPAEVEVLSLLAAGLTPKQAAVVLGRAPSTIREQIKTARQRLEANSGLHAVAIGIRTGQLP